MIETNIIKCWISHLMTDEQPDLSLIDINNFLEDGMTFSQYWHYERENFKNLSAIFDLSGDFKIEILHKWKIDFNRNYYFIYIINHYNKIVCKMNLTINENGKICGNGFYCQIVPKFFIKNSKIDGFGLAIKSPYEVVNIVCPSLEKILFEKGLNFEDDSFYTAKFVSALNTFESSCHIFYVTMKDFNDRIFTEKRKIFFDEFKKELFPLKIHKESVEIINNTYPVHLSVVKYDGSHENYVYPRNLIINLQYVCDILLTDCLDNDWKISFDNKILAF